MELVTGSRKIALEVNFPPDNCPPIQLPPRKIAPQTIAPEENWPLTIKLPLKIVAPTQATSSQRVLRVS